MFLVDLRLSDAEIYNSALIAHIIFMRSVQYLNIDIKFIIIIIINTDKETYTYSFKTRPFNMIT